MDGVGVGRQLTWRNDGIEPESAWIVGTRHSPECRDETQEGRKQQEMLVDGSHRDVAACAVKRRRDGDENASGSGRLTCRAVSMPKRVRRVGKRLCLCDRIGVDTMEMSMHKGSSAAGAEEFN